MRYLLDTNALSETAKPAPDRTYAAWAGSQDARDFAVSVVTFGEVKKGIELLPRSRRREVLEDWLATAAERDFPGRVLAVSTEVALEWGRLSAEGQRRGRVLPPVDGFILATAAVHRLVLITRNERDFADRGVPVLNPWSGN